MVCPPAEPVGSSLVPRGPRELGDSAVRISPPGSRQPDRLHCALTVPAQDPSRSDHARVPLARELMTRLTAAGATIAAALVVSTASAQAPPERARDLGIPLEGVPGPLD